MGTDYAEMDPPAGWLVAGLFTRLSDAEGALNNLDEAGYAADRISVLAADPRRVQTLTDAAGPLSALPPNQVPAYLGRRGLSADEARAYATSIAAGAVVVLIAAPDGSEESAHEILTDQHGQHVTVLRHGADE